MRKMRSMTSAAAFTHYQQQPVIVQNLVDIGSVAEDGSELNHTTTVRDVVTRQIRNSKVKWMEGDKGLHCKKNKFS